MICETCEGEGYMRGKDEANPGALVLIPCLDCLGSGGVDSPAIKRLIEEVRDEKAGRRNAYNRIYTRHNRS
jgi:hypothetical protein